jgi:rSAM/selenodomain-associated transferase 1
MTHFKFGIGIMARAPSAGKTRLGAHLSPRRLETLRAALLADTLDVVASACTEVDEAVIFFTPSGSENEIATLAPHSFAHSLQVDGDLGQRMRAAIGELLDARRCDAAVIVGSDIPFLGVDAIVDAREELRARGGVVLGPAEDGGYYLIGMAQVHAPLFEGIEWGTSRVLADSMRAAARCGIDARLIRRAYDVDTIEDLRRLERDLASASDGAAPRVRRWFSRT